MSLDIFFIKWSLILQIQVSYLQFLNICEYLYRWIRLIFVISISYNLKYKFLLSHLTILKLDLVFFVSSSFSQMFATSKTIINNFLHLLFNQNAQNSIKTNHNSWPGILFHWTRIISTSQSFVGKTFFP